MTGGILWRAARRGAVVAGLVTALLSPVALADDGAVPEPGVPVLNEPVARGTATVSPAPPVAPSPKVVDGAIGDWAGVGTGFGGTLVHGAGELVYQDHEDSYAVDRCFGDMVLETTIGLLDP